MNRRELLALGLGAGMLTVTGPGALGSANAARPGITRGIDRRGVLIDVGRKYFTLTWLKRLVSYSAAIGLNELHLHFSENECTRIASVRFPEINSGRQYSPAQIAELSDHATDRGVAVVPEFDMPGHMGAVLRAHPDLQLRNRFGDRLPTALNIADERALRFAEALLKEYTAMFPRSTHWSMGFDEFLGPVPVESLYANLEAEAMGRYGPRANLYDLLTATANRWAQLLADRGFVAGVYNDGMLRSGVVPLRPDITVRYWTHWSPQQTPLQPFLDSGHHVMNFNDRQLYYTLQDTPIYPHPTADSILESHWQPGQFSPLLPISQPGPVPPAAAGPQTIAGPPYPAQLAGAVFSIWCDDPAAQSEEQLFRAITEPLAAFALRCRDPGYHGSSADVADYARAAERAMPSS